MGGGREVYGVECKRRMRSGRRKSAWGRLTKGNEILWTKYGMKGKSEDRRSEGGKGRGRGDRWSEGRQRA